MASSELRYSHFHEYVISYLRVEKNIKTKIAIISDWINVLNTTRADSNKTFGDLLRSANDVEFPDEFNRCLRKFEMKFYTE